MARDGQERIKIILQVHLRETICGTTAMTMIYNFENSYVPSHETNSHKLVHLVIEGKEGVKFLHCESDALQEGREGEQVKGL